MFVLTSYSVNVNDDNADVDDLKLRNDPSESNVENLINLPYLHEPAILFCLQVPRLLANLHIHTIISINFDSQATIRQGRYLHLHRPNSDRHEPIQTRSLIHSANFGGIL